MTICFPQTPFSRTPDSVRNPPVHAPSHQALLPLTGCCCWRDMLPNAAGQYALAGRRSVGHHCFVEMCLRT
ncbi:MAG: hypothetical protein IJT04_07160 [Bacteroidales bacterium]|nr:hypothetical protein [Bacteroidales bacterium]